MTTTDILTDVVLVEPLYPPHLLTIIPTASARVTKARAPAFLRYPTIGFQKYRK